MLCLLIECRVGQGRNVSGWSRVAVADLLVNLASIRAF